MPDRSTRPGPNPSPRGAFCARFAEAAVAVGGVGRWAGRGCARSLLFIMLVLVGSPAEAQRPDARNMSCAQAKALVQSRGAVVISTGQHTYDRFVASANFCMRGERLDPAWIGTGDGAQCQVGFVCRAPFPRPKW